MSQGKCISDEIKMPQLYGVYLLRSLRKKNSFYIGSTPDPHRRLRQHNGELTRGGAYRTRRNGFRPWKMVLFVYGFPSNVSALQFEHAWQHAYQTRHIPVCKRRHNGKRHTGSGTSVDEKLANCRLLLCSDSFKRLGIQIAVFDKEIYQVWIKNKFHILIPDYVHMNIRMEDLHTEEDKDDNDACFIKGGNYLQIKQFKESVYASEEELKSDSIAKTKMSNMTNSCSICAKEIDQKLDLVVYCIYKDCLATYDLKCWAQSMLNEKQLNEENNEKQKQSSIKPIIPIRGHCLKCKRVNFWNTVIRNALHVKDELQSTQSSQLDE